MSDLYFTEDGDVTVSPTGDFAIADTPWRDVAQQAYIRLMTERSDWTMYPEIGAELYRLFGMPQTASTGEFGKLLVQQALTNGNRFTGYPITVKAVPTGMQTIRFDVYITVGARDELLLSIQQNLNLE